MRLKVVGAGLGRTGTTSLKHVLQQLTGGPCYHMFEVIGNPEAVAGWSAVVRGESDGWDGLLGAYAATVDWPAAAYWPELAAANPDAIVLLSSRATAEEWWTSMEKTIIRVLTTELPPENPGRAAHRAMVTEMLERRFTPDWRQPEAAMAAYVAHNERVRSEVPSDRLVDWQPGDGWDPICNALGVETPAGAFPHENSSAQFEANVEGGFDPGDH